VYYHKIFYNNPTHLYKTSEIKQQNYCDNTYTDTITPYDKLGRRCSLNDYEYSFNASPNYGLNLQSTFEINNSINHKTGLNTILNGDKFRRFNRTMPLKNINKNGITTIFARLVIDTVQTP